MFAEGSKAVSMSLSHRFIAQKLGVLSMNVVDVLRRWYHIQHNSCTVTSSIEAVDPRQRICSSLPAYRY